MGSLEIEFFATKIRHIAVVTSSLRKQTMTPAAHSPAGLLRRYDRRGDR